jgi:hypothetical protein
MDDDAFDAGAVAGRTLFAWRRTALLIGVTSVLGARMLADRFGPAVFALALLGLALSLAAHGYASARYRSSAEPTAKGDPAMVSSGRGLGALSAAVVVLALIALMVVVTINRT